MDNTIPKCTKIKLIHVRELLTGSCVREMKKFMLKIVLNYFKNYICVHVYLCLDLCT